MTPIMIPTPIYTRPSKSDEQIIYEEALKRYTDPVKLESFQEGARYWKKRQDVDGISFLGFVLAVWLVIQFVGLVGGFMHAAHGERSKITRMVYLVPAFYASNAAFSWLMEEKR